ncbi:MAG: flexitail domain-containing putative surface protein [Dehalococcoidia bacterium]
MNILFRHTFLLAAALLLVAGAAGLGLSGRFGGAVQAASTVVVKPSDMQGWAFFDDNGQGGAYGFVSGPGSPPAGSGSADLKLVASNQGIAVGTAAYANTRMDAITTFSYSTYRSSGAAALALALAFDADYDLTDGNTSFQGRLVFEPYYTNTVLTGSWQTWDTLTSAGTGNWWASNAIGAAFCPIGNPCTWSEVLSHFPDAGVRSTSGGLLFKAGSGWASFNGNVDNLQIDNGSGVTTYDFESETCTTDCYVNGTYGDDSFDGASAASAKKTVQGGVNAVAAGGTVHVAAGTYPEQVVVTTDGVTIDGAGATTSIKPTSVSANTTSLSSGNPLAPIVLVDDATGVSIKHVKVDGVSAAFGACSPGYLGVFFRNASGAIDASRVTNVFHPTAAGCQAVIGVLVQSGGAGSADVDITGSTIDNYGKNGITCNEAATTCDVSGNTITGRGPVGAGDAAQNGVQLGFGAGGSVVNNNISGHDYTPDTAAATGILVFSADAGVQIDGNNVHDNMEGIFVQSTSGIDVTGNTVTSTRDTGIFGFDITAGTLDDNDVTGNTVGVWLADSSNNTVSASTISGNEHGIIIDGNSIGAFITGNNILTNTGSSSGVHVEAFGGFSPSNIEVHGNNIVGNGGSGGYGVFNSTTNVVNATNNWWGACDGPSGVAPGSGDPVTANVTYVPFTNGKCDDDGDLLSNDYETSIAGTNPNNPDTDGDGCQDGRELQPATLGTVGGGRNPLNYWDFFDTPELPNNRDKVIDLFVDILGVAMRFGANDAGGTAAINRNTDPTSAPPVSPTAYHPAFDRGSQIGIHNWELAPADGDIDLFNDIFGIAYQFGHDCN